MPMVPKLFQTVARLITQISVPMFFMLDSYTVNHMLTTFKLYNTLTDEKKFVRATFSFSI